MTGSLLGPTICLTHKDEGTHKVSKAMFVSTDGAPCITGEKAGLVSLFTKEVGHPVMCKSWPEGTSESDANSYQSCELHFCSGIT